MYILKVRFALTALLLGGVAHAEPATVIRLTPEQIAAIRAEAEAAGKPASVSESEPRKDRVHGEVAVSIGTGGDREIAGAINTPLGSDGRAQIEAGAKRWPRPSVIRNADRR